MESPRKTGGASQRPFTPAAPQQPRGYYSDVTIAGEGSATPRGAAAKLNARQRAVHKKYSPSGASDLAAL